ncbi:hypothetical protein Cgig2_002585 [Carnegiea gigantea]|uniref:Uncharacterized protein n=1 Tax=Carnegiea gigantea TaxID=171969 RepID=A0A9Q1GPT0_9CARY|nr:hypothetical protein Cgig2_002585 [Carnegiea gigantea]
MEVGMMFSNLLLGSSRMRHVVHASSACGDVWKNLFMHVVLCQGFAITVSCCCEDADHTGSASACGGGGRTDVVLSFEERLTRVRDALHKEKEAHVSTHAKLELWKARVAELQSTFGSSGIDAHVGAEATCQRGSPADDMPHMVGENVETEGGSGKSNSAADKDAEQDIGVRTEGRTVPHPTGPEMPHMAAEVCVADEAVSTMPAPRIGEGREGDVRYTGGLGETASVPEQWIETPAAVTIIATHPLDHHDNTANNEGLYGGDEDMGQAEQVRMERFSGADPRKHTHVNMWTKVQDEMMA